MSISHKKIATTNGQLCRSQKYKSRELTRWFEDILEGYFGVRPRIELRQQDPFDYWEISWIGGKFTLSIRPICEEFYEAGSIFEMRLFDTAVVGVGLTDKNKLHFPLFAGGQTKNNGCLLWSKQTAAWLEFDLLGFMFWCFCRVEELSDLKRDAHGRFTAKQCHAARNGYLAYPIIDEWFHLLRSFLVRIWPEFPAKQRAGKVCLSHDVDWPSRYAFARLPKLVSRVAADVLKRGQLDSLAKAPTIRALSGQTLLNFDDHNNFDWMMTHAEKSGLQTCFYFMATEQPCSHDVDYSINHPVIAGLMQKIHARGHQIGLHPSYNSHLSEKGPIDEAGLLQTQMEKCGIKQNNLPSRMHYLRWDINRSPAYLAGLGVSQDASLGYADQVGFRCGTSYEFPAFDPLKMQILPFSIKPLIVMDTTIFASKYLGRDIEGALDLLQNIKLESQKCGGNFSLLWHNNNLVSSAQKQLFSGLLEQWA